MYIKLPEKASCTGNGAKKPGKAKNPEAKKPGFDCIWDLQNQYLSDTKVTLQELDSALEQLKSLFYQFFDICHMFQSANNYNKCQN